MIRFLQRNHPEVNRNLYIIFAVLVFSLLLTVGLILYKEANPEWKRYQKAFFLQETEKVINALANADQTQRLNLEKRLRYLRRPHYRIRQILLNDGTRSDRCTTCHLDLKPLEKKHTETDQFPFEQYGCTVCHGGVGRATEKLRAHSTLRIPRRPLFEYLQARETGASPLDLFRYRADGKRIKFTGSNLCLRCHLSSHPRHVKRWRNLKFKPLDRVMDKLKKLRESGLSLDDSQCFLCHTTAFDERTGRFLEDQVTCESCHGPGGFYTELMAGGKAREGAELARVSIFETRADQVCLNCHKPDRHRAYEGEDIPTILISAYLKEKSAPEIDGKIQENIWSIALEQRVPTWILEDGNFRPGTVVFIRSMYSDTDLYFSFRWRDETRQDQMGQWSFSDGQWRAEVTWPDALALHWQASKEVDDFVQGGCAVLCHNTGRFKEFPRMVAGQEGALVDEWYWNAFAAAKAGRPGDGFLDHQVKFILSESKKSALRWALPAISAAHGSDASGDRIPETVGGVPLILNANKIEGKPPSPQFYLEGGQRIPLQQAAGNELKDKFLPLYELGAPEGGDSADIRGRASWSDGYWTLELSRPLRTSSKQDVQLDPLKKNYSFGLAVWNGETGDQHQVATIIKLRFETVNYP